MPKMWALIAALSLVTMGLIIPETLSASATTTTTSTTTTTTESNPNCQLDSTLGGQVVIEDTLNDCTFSNTDFDGISVESNNFKGTTWNKLQAIGTKFAGNNFSSGIFQGGNFSGAHMLNENFVGANFSTTNFTDANFGYSNLTDANLAGVNLSRAELSQATLTGVLSSGITGVPASLPTGWTISNGVLLGPGAATIKAPSAPLSVSTKVRSSTSITVIWSLPKSDGGSPITRYCIKSVDIAKGKNVSKCVETSNLQALDYKFGGLSPDTSYEFTVAAWNSKLGAWSSRVKGTTKVASKVKSVSLSAVQANRIVSSTPEFLEDFVDAALSSAAVQQPQEQYSCLKGEFDTYVAHNSTSWQTSSVYQEALAIEESVNQNAQLMSALNGAMNKAVDFAVGAVIAGTAPEIVVSSDILTYIINHELQSAVTQAALKAMPKFDASFSWNSLVGTTALNEGEFQYLAADENLMAISGICSVP